MLEIQSERLFLRSIKTSDINNIHSLHSFAEVDEFNTLGIPKDKNETKSIIEKWLKDAERTNILAISLKKDQQFIGLIGLSFGSAKSKRVEIWYKLMPMHWENGYATEVLKKVRNYCFEILKIHRIEAGCAVDNHASIRVLEKIGMIKEGRGRDKLALKKGWSDNYAFAILDTDPRP